MHAACASVWVAPPRGLAPSSSRCASRHPRNAPIPPSAAFGKGKDVSKIVKDESFGGAVSGAVLGGLLLGPFGAVLGGQFGANFGSDRKRARQADTALRKQGITPDMVKAVEECAEGLRNAEAGLRSAKDSFTLNLEEAAELDAEVETLYEAATTCVTSGDDDGARKYLTKRKQVQTKLGDAKQRATEAKRRVESVERSVATLSSQAKKLESILRENMASAAETNASEAAAKFGGEQYSSAGDLEAAYEDPLEKKFRDLEGR